MHVGLELAAAVASVQAWGAEAVPVADDLSQDLVRSQVTGKDRTFAAIFD
ncbi:MAG TPA: hypothetical protein VGD42_11365 [Lysobacter sp.]